MKFSAKFGIDGFGVGIIDGVNFVVLRSDCCESKYNAWFVN
jgi:hypothetical protein